MKTNVSKWIRRLVTCNKVTKFVSKLTRMCNGYKCKDFKDGDFVCLKHDMLKRFIVVDNTIIEGKIHLTYFNESTGLMALAFIEPKYLMPAPKQGDL